MELSVIPSWSTGTKIAFRFFFVYFLLYVLPFPLYFIPYFSDLWQFIFDFSFQISDSIWKSLAGLDYKSLVPPGGSGDTTFNYLQVGAFGVSAAIGCIIWSLVDAKRKNYETLFYWLCILLRYYLAYFMLLYGFIKVFKSQFPFPSVARLSQTYGSSSPMGLLWTFMGYSEAYNIFTGMGEVFGGLFLLFKRTKILGALITIGVMSNVVMLNFSYDVPVKLFSLHLLAIAIFLIVPDFGRLINFFLLNKPVDPSQLKPVYISDRTKKIYLVTKSLIVLFIVGSLLFQAISAKNSYGRKMPPASLTTFEVVTHIINKDTINPEGNETRRFKRIIVQDESTIKTRFMDDVTLDWKLVADSAQREIIMNTPDHSTLYKLKYRLSGDQTILEGKVNDDSVTVVMKKGENQQFLLVSRGFHWINEYPFNR